MRACVWKYDPIQSTIFFLKNLQALLVFTKISIYHRPPPPTFLTVHMYAKKVTPDFNYVHRRTGQVWWDTTQIYHRTLKMIWSSINRGKFESRRKNLHAPNLLILAWMIISDALKESNFKPRCVVHLSLENESEWAILKIIRKGDVWIIKSVKLSSLELRIVDTDVCKNRRYSLKKF